MEEYFTGFEKIVMIMEGLETIVAIASLIISLLFLISIMIIFEKAGYSWWKVLVPVYNLFCFYELIGLSGGFTAFVIFLPLILGVSNGLLVKIFPPLAILAVILDIIIIIYIDWKVSDRLAKSFGKDIVWSLLIFFFQPLMIMIIAFSKNIKYGNRVTPKLVPITNGVPTPTTGGPVNPGVTPTMNFDPNTGEPLNNQITPNTTTEQSTIGPTGEQNNQANSDMPDSIESIIIKQ